MYNSKFIAINILVEDIVINKVPIIYYWDQETKISDLFINDNFIKYINENIGPKNYVNSIANIIFVNDDLTFESKSYEIQSLSPLIYNNELCDRFIKDVLEYLYEYSFKTKPENLTISEIFRELLKKYPNKINKEVVSQYLLTKLNEDYPNLLEGNTNEIKNRFKNLIDI